MSRFWWVSLVTDLGALACLILEGPILLSIILLVAATVCYIAALADVRGIA